jgi:hypothetical protein
MGMSIPPHETWAKPCDNDVVQNFVRAKWDIDVPQIGRVPIKPAGGVKTIVDIFWIYTLALICIRNCCQIRAWSECS